MNEKYILTVTLNPCIDKTFTVGKFKKGGTNIVSAVKNDAGGKGINVSKVLTNFKTDNVALGISGGENGRFLGSLLGLCFKV